MDRDPRNPESDRLTIRSWFWVRMTPEGDAPLEVRQQWVDLLLPLRYDRDKEKPNDDLATELVSGDIISVPDAIHINADDAIRVLRLNGREKAAVWFEDYYMRRGGRLDLHGLVFDHIVGQLMTPELAERFFPGSTELTD